MHADELCYRVLKSVCGITSEDKENLQNGKQSEHLVLVTAVHLPPKWPI